MWIWDIYDYVTLRVTHMNLGLPQITFCPFLENTSLHSTWWCDMTHGHTLAIMMTLAQVTTWQWWHGLHDEVAMPSCIPCCFILHSWWYIWSMFHLHEGSSLFSPFTLQRVFNQYQNPLSHHECLISFLIHDLLQLSMIALFCSSSLQVFIYDLSLLYVLRITLPC